MSKPSLVIIGILAGASFAHGYERPRVFNENSFSWQCPSTARITNDVCSNVATKLLPACGFKPAIPTRDGKKEYCSIFPGKKPGERDIWGCGAYSNNCYITEKKDCSDLGGEPIGNKKIMHELTNVVWAQTLCYRKPTESRLGEPATKSSPAAGRAD